MIKLLRKIFNKSEKSQKGSVLTTTIIVMAILATAATAITSTSMNQYNLSNIQLDLVNDESTGKKLIEQSIAEFELYMQTFSDFDTYESIEAPLVFTNYGVEVNDVTLDFADEGFGPDGTGESRVYAFTYELNNGNVLVMYSYVSTVGSTVQQFNPFDFTIGTNGDLVLTSGYYADASFFANNIYFNQSAPYTYDGEVDNISDGNARYPSFNNNGRNSSVFYKGVYEYCGSYCFDNTALGDSYVMDTRDFDDIFDSNLKTGNAAQDTVVSDFFGTFDFDQNLIDFIKNVAPTEDMVITEAMNMQNMISVIEANTSAPQQECGWTWWGWYCWLVASGDKFTDLTDITEFDLEYDDITLGTSSYYNGDLTIRNGLHMSDLTDEALIINGDLIIDSNQLITMDGKFVVLGDLKFLGSTVDMDGAFYVLGQTIIDFDEGEGIQEVYTSTTRGRGGGGITSLSEYGMSILSKDNIIVYSMWESHYKSELPNVFDAFIYTDESIYIDAINSKLYMNGVMFARALGVSDNKIPVNDENGDPIMGIYIASFRGYIKTNGNEVGNNNKKYERFYLDAISADIFQSEFVEIPDMDSLIMSEGFYTFERSEFDYLDLP